MLQAPVVGMDWQRHSCIVVRVTPKKIFFIPMLSDGLSLVELGVDKFLEKYKLTNYPVGRAASHYLHAAASLECSASARKQLEMLKAPGTAEALTGEAAKALLAKVSIIDLNGDVVCPVMPAAESLTTEASSEKEQQMAAAKKEPAAQKPAAAKKEPATKKPAASPEKSGRKPGVGALIMDAILAGKDTEEILMDVREQFPDSKAEGTTVSWYRGKLRKEGKLKE